jgi:hypothetical protein
MKGLMMKKVLLFGLVMLICSLNAFATIRYVSATGAGSYTVINIAANAAVSGDTILIGPGTYSLTGSINEVNKKLIYIGAGWDQSIVNMTGDTWWINSAGASGTSFEGLQVNSNQAQFTIANSADQVAFRRCYFGNTSTNNRIVLASTGRGVTMEDCILLMNSSTSGSPVITITDSNYPSTFRNCVFVNRGGSNNCRAIGGASTSGTVELYNCVFLNYQAPLALSASGGPVIGVNNLFYDWIGSPSVGSYNASSVWDYNASATGVTTPGTNGLAISSDPFVNYDESLNYQIGVTDLNLDPTNGAAFIDSGHPSLLDFTDATTSDRGVYGGPKPLVDNGVPNYPWAVNIVLNPNLVGVGTPVNATALGRVGPQY